METGPPWHFKEQPCYSFWLGLGLPRNRVYSIYSYFMGKIMINHEILGESPPVPSFSDRSTYHTVGHISPLYPHNKHQMGRFSEPFQGNFFLPHPPQYSIHQRGSIQDFKHSEKPRFLDIVNMKRIGFPPFFIIFPQFSYGFWIKKPKVLALRCPVGEPDAFPPRCSPWPRWFRGG